MSKRIKTLAVILFLLLADQGTKLWALKILKPGRVITLIPGVLEFTYLENRGAAFGILQNRQWVFLIMSAAVLAAILWILPRIPDEKRFCWLYGCVTLLAAGAAGNMIDRIFRRYVVDFIYFRLIDFPVFNVADIFVTVSAFALVLLIFFYYKEADLDRVIKKHE